MKNYSLNLLFVMFFGTLYITSFVDLVTKWKGCSTFIRDAENLLMIRVFFDQNSYRVDLPWCLDAKCLDVALISCLCLRSLLCDMVWSVFLFRIPIEKIKIVEIDRSFDYSPICVKKLNLCFYNWIEMAIILVFRFLFIVSEINHTPGMSHTQIFQFS